MGRTLRSHPRARCAPWEALAKKNAGPMGSGDGLQKSALGETNQNKWQRNKYSVYPIWPRCPVFFGRGYGGSRAASWVPGAGLGLGASGLSKGPAGGFAFLAPSCY
ncbi:MAG: hypothetical protein CM15mP74_06270 [Halieaceae bacterium]|nr:MAG: hypothetical protein CM15mP74_06270 [Halieaceae bacterium]